MKKILFASNNLGKLNELKEIFKDYEVISPKNILVGSCSTLPHYLRSASVYHKCLAIRIA